MEIQEHARLARQYLRLEPRAPRPVHLDFKAFLRPEALT